MQTLCERCNIGKSNKLDPEDYSGKCNICGSELVLRKGRNGEFLGCSQFPNCTFTKSVKQKRKNIIKKGIKMKKSRKGLNLTGILITYVMSSIYILAIVLFWLEWGFYDTEEVIIFVLSVITLVLTILYDINKITNYILIGVLGIFASIAGGIFIYLDEAIIIGIIGIPTNIIGGIFILVGQQNNDNNNTSTEDKNLSNLEYKLRQLDTLLTKGVLTKEEYDLKRQSIIDKN